MIADKRKRGWVALALAFLAGSASLEAAGPYERQVAEQVAALRGPEASRRSAAAEALGYLRAYAAAPPLRKALTDSAAEVRREAAMSLGFCGGRADVAALLSALDDGDWTVRQAAWVALTNLTGQEWPFDALAPVASRRRQAGRWRSWWEKVPADRPPTEVLALLPGGTEAPPPAAGPDDDQANLARGCTVTGSTTYKGPPGVLTDGRSDQSAYWQTKNVPFPQHCTVDLGKARTIGCVVVQQYGRRFCMTDCAIAVSADGKAWTDVYRRRSLTPIRLVTTFAPRPARYVRVASYATENPTYPTTFLEIEVTPKRPPAPPTDAPDSRADDPAHARAERGLRALGALGGEGAAERIAAVVAPYARGRRAGGFATKCMVHAGLRALGRLGDPNGVELLTALLDDVYWARYAADALGDACAQGAPPVGFEYSTQVLSEGPSPRVASRGLSRKIASALLIAYPKFARDLRGRAPSLCPRDDHPGGFPSVDRMYETPYAILSALARLPLDDERARAELGGIAPLLLANLPADFDGAMIYEPEVGQIVTAHLLERLGLRRAACEAAFARFGQPASVPDTPFGRAAAQLARRVSTGVPHAAAWLPALCRDSSDVPRLTALLTHKDGWVRINAAKALIFLAARPAAGRIAEVLTASKAEAEFGYCPTFIKDEYNALAPRWREAMVKALGRLGGGGHVGLLTRLMDDERNVLEVRYAAAEALGELGGPAAVDALKRAARAHSFHSVRMVAREALWKRGFTLSSLPMRPPEAHGTRPVRIEAHRLRPVGTAADRRTGPDMSENARTQAPLESCAIVFIQGPNKMPNRFQIDPWRQTYSTTDSGPAYRVGRNLHVLQPARADGTVRPLTKFTDGWVADCEVSWDGRRVLFSRRGEKDPWWHVWEIGATGGGLRQLTRGPYHDVQPAYLPGGRIVFSTSRIGTRDEYHGYPCTGLAAMDSAGRHIRFIGLNLGRDNEPSILPDGRIAFSRLEVFYSRLKTELTVQAAFPDGTRNVTLYGPERRDFWRGVTRASGERGWGESGPRHRVLRCTQPQGYGPDRILCASTGGLTLLGPSRHRESLLPHSREFAVTSPFPLPDGRVLCAASPKKRTGPKRRLTDEVDLGLYVMDAETGEMDPLYNDPNFAEFEPRPLAPRPCPPVLPEDPPSAAYTGKLFCSSARICQEARVTERAKLVRVIEGRPFVARHQTHTNPGEVWRNHTGTFARVLGTAPLAPDGSFYVEAPADRLLHFQVLDSDRRVVGNQLTWIYPRPGETKSCVGCHEHPHTTSRGGDPLASHGRPLRFLPTGKEFRYRAKAWFKGHLPPEIEERTRTARAVNLLGR